MKKVMVLVVTDKEKFLSYCTFSLQASGFTVFRCKPDILSVEIAVMQHRPSIVIFDSSDFGGVQAKALVKNLDAMHNSPIIFNLFSYEEETKIDELENYGVVRSYQAPFDYDQIARYIRRYIDELPVDYAQVKMEIKARISEVLSVLNFNNCMQGYNYIRDAILMTTINVNKLYNFSKDVYSELSKNYSVSPYSVERAMRVCISNAWKRTNENVAQIFFNTDALKNGKKPTNSEFVLMLAEFIHNEFSSYLEVIEEKRRQEIFNY